MDNELLAVYFQTTEKKKKKKLSLIIILNLHLKIHYPGNILQIRVYRVYFHRGPAIFPEDLCFVIVLPSSTALSNYILTVFAHFRETLLARS